MIRFDIYHHFTNSPAEDSKLDAILALLGKIQKQGDHIMSAVSDFAAKVDAAFAKLGTAVDGIVSDVQNLKDQIAALQNSPGTLTPEDQATLDRIQATADGLATKAADLDAATEPAVVPAP